jgi:hypothetical protein
MAFWTSINSGVTPQLDLPLATAVKMRHLPSQWEFYGAGGLIIGFFRAKAATKFERTTSFPGPVGK